MIVKNSRYISNHNGTLGIMLIDDVLYGYWLEDRPRDVKVKGDTCILAGDYDLKFREDDTPLTLKYRKRFAFFTFHIELQNVARFKNVYCHIGNTIKDTEACNLMGLSVNCNVKAHKDPKYAQFFLGNSADCFRIVYPIIANALKNNEKVIFQVRDV